MIIKLFTVAGTGLNVQKVEVEVDTNNGLPAVTVVGLPDKAVQESKERIRSAIKQSGVEFPMEKIIINLAPADIAKNGTSFDLPMAVGILQSSGEIKKQDMQKRVIIGELALNGNVRAVNGVLSTCLWARKNGIEEVFIPAENEQEGALVKNIKVYAINNLKDIIKHLNGKESLEPIEPIDIESLGEKEDIKNSDGLYHNDMAYVKGQKVAKRALEIAAAGGHNTLFIGVPGSGKTLLARSYPTILPRMTEDEILETTQIYSSCGLLRDGKIITKRPFRGPHHSSSHVALVGGGSKLRPGEISLAHRGVLFLDEFPEFKRETIEVLRQPLEDGFVTISRASGSATYPSRFYLLAAANPTPSGFDPDEADTMNKPQNRAAIARYQAKFSGPILDRIDIQVEVEKIGKDELQSKKMGEPSEEIIKRVQKARNIQTKRFVNEKIHTNAEMPLPLIKKFCKLDQNGEKLMDQAIEKFKLSGRGYIRLLKLSRTIADLAEMENIDVSHIAESLQYRGRWGSSLKICIFYSVIHNLLQICFTIVLHLQKR